MIHLSIFKIILYDYLNSHKYLYLFLLKKIILLTLDIS